MRIEAGKYYRTRDGRKVGPMEDCGTGDGFPFTENVINGWWSADGKRQDAYLSNTNLIAEWSDDPEAPHFIHMLAELQAIAERYGYTISEVSADDGFLGVDFTLTN